MSSLELSDSVHTHRLERMYQELSRAHCLDVLTRRAILANLGALGGGDTVIDIGCASGHLLQDLHRSMPDLTLIGLDMVESGLEKARAAIPDALLLQGDACALPLEDESVDAVTCSNLLEHIRDDERALAEIGRVLRPTARAVIVVPVGPGNYDCFDRFCGHERRYARGELAFKASRAGLQVLEDVCLGALLYPAFWLVKQRNRRRYEQLRGDALERRALSDSERTAGSSLGSLACRLEEWLLSCGVRPRFGIRGLTVLARAGSAS